jgi:hypothetical protein
LLGGVWLLGAELVDAADLGAGDGSLAGGCADGSGGSAPMMSPGVLLSTSAAKLAAARDRSGKTGFDGAFAWDAFAAISDVTLNTSGLAQSYSSFSVRKD